MRDLGAESKMRSSANENTIVINSQGEGEGTYIQILSGCTCVPSEPSNTGNVLYSIQTKLQSVQKYTRTDNYS